jgi:hypothetical protein
VLLRFVLLKFAFTNLIKKLISTNANITLTYLNFRLVLHKIIDFRQWNSDK